MQPNSYDGTHLVLTSMVAHLFAARGFLSFTCPQIRLTSMFPQRLFPLMKMSFFGRDLETFLFYILFFPCVLQHLTKVGRDIGGTRICDFAHRPEVVEPAVVHHGVLAI